MVLKVNSDDLHAFIEDAVIDICEGQDLYTTAQAFSSLALRYLGEYDDKGKRDLAAVDQISILTELSDVHPAKTARLMPVILAISSIRDKKRRAAVILNHIRALALLIDAD
jgi:hypothetical protein